MQKKTTNYNLFNSDFELVKSRVKLTSIEI